MNDEFPYFPKIVGQREALSSLSFYIDGYKRTSVLPNLFLTGARGQGKTTIAKLLARQLVITTTVPDEPVRHKRLVSVSGAEFQHRDALSAFINGVVVPYLGGERFATLFFDEIHLSNPSVLNWLLHVLNSDDNKISTNTYNDVEFTFDFRYFSFIAASTNAEKLSKPLADRLVRINLKPYTINDLSKILKAKNPDIIFEDGVDKEIVSCMRGSPRKVVLFSKRVLNQYVAISGNTTFGFDDWKKLKGSVGIRPLGLVTAEINVLRFLKERGDSTLTEIAARLELDATTVRRDCEPFLLSHGLMNIDKKRIITKKGQEILMECKE